MRVQISGLKELSKAFREIKRGMSSQALNRKRADDFASKVPGEVKAGRAGLRKNKAATEKIQGAGHPPLSWTGELADAVSSRDGSGNEAEAGIWTDRKPRPRALSDGHVSQSKLSITEIAIMQSVGFRIPLTGANGEKVRGFLSRYGIFMKATKSFLVVTARPFLGNLATAHSNSGKDLASADGYMTKVWARL